MGSQQAEEFISTAPSAQAKSAETSVKTDIRCCVECPRVLSESFVDIVIEEHLWIPAVRFMAELMPNESGVHVSVEIDFKVETLAGPGIFSLAIKTSAAEGWSRDGEVLNSPMEAEFSYN